MTMIRFTILDTETTGLNPQWGDNIIEVALLVAEYDGTGFTEITRFDSLVKPDMDITERVTYITGIRREDVENAPHFPEIEKTVERYLQGSIVVGHNVEFDLKFLESAGLTTASLPRLDTMDLASLFEEEGKSLSLESLAVRHAVQHDAHRAMGDVLATFEILKHYTQLLATLDPLMLGVMQHVLPRSDWPGKTLFPTPVADRTLEESLEGFFSNAEQKKSDVRDAPSSEPDEISSITLESLLTVPAQAVAELPCVAAHAGDILRAARKWSDDENRTITVVLTEFPDSARSYLNAHPSLRLLPNEYVVDIERTKAFFISEQWDKHKVLFALRLLSWYAASPSGNAKDLPVKRPERRYLYSILPVESSRPNKQPQKMWVMTLREFLAVNGSKKNSPVLLLDATFVDEEIARAGTETLTLHRVMNALQAVEEIIMQPDATLVTDPALRQSQEKAAFFFAHLASVLSRLEVKEAMMDTGTRTDRKIVESAELASSLSRQLEALGNQHASRLCAALKKELSSVCALFEAYAQPQQGINVVIALRGRDEGTIQMVRTDGLESLRAMLKDHPRLVLFASPQRSAHVLHDLPTISLGKAMEKLERLRVTIASDIRPDQSLHYGQRLAEWMRIELSRKHKDIVFVFGNGKILEQTVLALGPFLTGNAIPYFAERLGGGTAKVREFYEREPDKVLFCTVEFFTGLEARRIGASTFVLQKLPFSMDNGVVSWVEPSRVFEWVSLPKSLVRFERILCQIAHIPATDKELLILDNKLLTEKRYGGRFRDMLPDGWESKSLENM